MERMLEELGHRGQHAWDLLDRVAANTLSVAKLYHAFSHNDLEGLRSRLQAAETNTRDVDLADHVAPWTRWLADRVKQDTREHYLAHLRTMIPEGTPFRVAQFSAPAIAKWLNERTRLPQKRRQSISTSRGESRMSRRRR